MAMGGDPAETLRKFQEALTDQVLTIFFDFAMKPVEDFFKQQLSAFFNVPTEEESRKAAIVKMEEQLKELQASKAVQQNIDKNVAALAGGSAAPAPSGETQSTNNAFNAPAGTDFNSMLGGDEASLFGSIGLSGEVLKDFSSNIENFADTTMDSAGKFGDWTGTYGAQLSESLLKNTENANKQSNKFSESLGKTVQGIGIAAGSIMGIAAGISQIKQGGVSGVLGGIGSIFMSLGGALGGFGKLFGWTGFATGGIASGGFQAFADGGMVNGPTLGLVGEGKYNEAIVPLPNGRSIPVELGGGIREKMNAPSSSPSSPILSMSFESTTINGVEYVSRDQLEQAMMETRRLATREGAQQGANLAIDKLQQSPNTRRRVGIR
jgi:hypothetical protein